MQSLNPQDSQTAAGLTNMTNAITSDLKSVGNYAATAPNALNLSTVQSLFPATSGWYSASAAAGAQLALAYLQSVDSASSGVAVSSTGVTLLGMTFSTTELLLGAALVLGFYFFGGN